MALGKAFIEVHADTRPFARELGRELGKILDEAEKDIVTKRGRSAGEKFGDNLSEGVKSRKGKIRSSLGEAFDPEQSKDLFTRFSTGIIDTIDDGISGLPAELKAILGVALAVAAPALGSGIAAIISSALAIGLAGAAGGIGVLVASQFEEVTSRAQEVFSNLRNIIVGELGASLVTPVDGALGLIEQRILDLGPTIERIFASSARIIIPLTDALLSFVEGFLPGLASAFESVEPLLPVISAGLRQVGEDLGGVIAYIVQDDDLVTALGYTFNAISQLIILVGTLTKFFLDLFGVLVEVSQALDIFGLLDVSLEGTAEASDRAAKASDLFATATTSTLLALDAEQKAVDEANKALKQYISDALGSRRATIDFEQALDDMSIELKDGKRSLDLNTQAGRDNQTAILNAVQALIQQRDATIAATGETDKANATFDTNRKRLEDAAVAAGISRDKFRELTGQILNVPSSVEIKVPNNGVNGAISRWQEFGNLIGTILQKAASAAAKAAGVPTSPNQLTRYADGGIVTSPTAALIGEAGPEVVIPLSNPSRAGQLLNQSGLAGAMGTSVNVYIGNQQLDAYISTGVRREMALTARTISYGTR